MSGKRPALRIAASTVAAALHPAKRGREAIPQRLDPSASEVYDNGDEGFRISHVSRRLPLAVLLVVISVGTAHADVKDPASEAEVVGEQVQEDLQPLPPPLSEEPLIEQALPPPPPSEAPTVSFTLTQVVLEGSTVLPASHFDPIIQPYLNREASAQNLQALAEALQQEYRAQGYLTTIVYAPPQKITGGRVTLQVLEGRMGRLTVEGNRYFNAHRFEWYWPTGSGEVLRYDTMRSALIRMNAHPDRQVQALLRAGAAPGQTDVILKVKDQMPLHLGTSWDHAGTSAIGQQRFGISGAHYNLLGLDDRLTIGMVFGQHFGVPYVQYQVPVTPYGTTAEFRFSHSQVSPRRQFKTFGVNGTSQIYGLSLTQMLIERKQMSLEAHLGLDVKDSRTLVSSATSRRERLRVVRLGPKLRTADSLGLWLAEMEGSFGIKGLGATSENNPVASRPGADPDFVKTELKVTRVQRMPWQTRIVASLRSQLASSKLSPQEQLYIGGQDSVRGYPEGDYLADHGVILRGEYLVPVRLLPDTWRIPWVEGPLHEHLDVLTFLDRGYGRQRAVTGEERTTRNLMGLGAGMHFQMKSATVRIEWGRAVGDRPLTDDSRYALHFSVQTNF